MATDKRFRTLMPFLLGVILFIGGLGYLPELTVVTGGTAAIFLLLLAFLKKKEISLPNGFRIYGLFLVFFLLSLIWSLDWWKSLSQLALFLSGGGFWVALYNLKVGSTRKIENIVLVLGVLFGAFALAYKYLDFAPFGRAAYSLVFPATDNHHHIGDFWAIASVIVIHKVFVKKKYLYSLLFIPASVFLLLSLSKSAYLALAVGAYFIFYPPSRKTSSASLGMPGLRSHSGSYGGVGKAKRFSLRRDFAPDEAQGEDTPGVSPWELHSKGWVQKYKNVFLVFVLLAVALFLFAGTQKTTLFSRPYFFQAVTGIVKHPFGVGYGNFETISSECFGCFSDKLASFSSLTHNIILEVMAGMGILGLSFIYWLYQVSKDMLKKTKAKNLVATASFFAILANFFFDFTYVIPTMLWLWFIFLGIAQREQVSS